MAFQPGQSGNPGGRASPARQELQALLDKHYTPAKRRATLTRLIELTEDGDPKVALEAIKLLLAYTYGKPTERKEISGPDNGPIPIQPFDPRTSLAPLTPGPMGDSDEPGAD